MLPININNQQKTISWHDFHPGWRFKRICDFLSSNKLEVKKDLSNYVDIQQQICTHFGWINYVRGFEYSQFSELKRLYSVFRSIDLAGDYIWVYIFHAHRYPHINYFPMEILQQSQKLNRPSIILPTFQVASNEHHTSTEFQVFYRQLPDIVINNGGNTLGLFSLSKYICTNFVLNVCTKEPDIAFFSSLFQDEYPVDKAEELMKTLLGTGLKAFYNISFDNLYSNNRPLSEIVGFDINKITYPPYKWYKKDVIPSVSWK
jgi:hypothetical protein